MYIENKPEAELTKWLRGIGSLIDGRIVISEKVLEFVNKEAGRTMDHTPESPCRNPEHTAALQ